MEWCYHLEASSSEVCDLILGSVDGQAHLVARLEEVPRGVQVMRVEHETLQSLATWGGGGLMRHRPQAVALSPSLSPELIVSRVNAAAINGVQWVA
jgi:hypothetical protein